MDRDQDPTPIDRCARCGELFGDVAPPVVWWVGESGPANLHAICAKLVASELYIAALGVIERGEQGQL